MNVWSLPNLYKWLLGAGIGLLFMRSGNFSLTHIPKPFEVFFLLSLLAAGFYLIRRNKLSMLREAVPARIWIASFLFIVSVLFGWSVGLFFMGWPFSLEMALEFGRISIAFATFLLVLLATYEDPRFIKIYFFALLAPAGYLFFLLFPGIAFSHRFALPDGRFYGFTNNVNTLSKLLLLPFILFSALFLCTKEARKKVFFLLLAGGMMGLFFWTASRGGLLAAAAGLLLISFLFLKQKFSLRRAGAIAVLFIASFSLGFLLTPKSGKQLAPHRLLTNDSRQIHYTQLKDEPLSTIVEDSFHARESFNQETRFEIWSSHVKEALQHPFGLGPAFYLNLRPCIPLLHECVGSGSHNSFIETFLWGGVMGFLGYMYIVWYAFRNLGRELRSNFTYFTLALVGALASLALSMFFDDNAAIVWFWVLLALAVNIRYLRVRHS